MYNLVVHNDLEEFFLCSTVERTWDGF